MRLTGAAARQRTAAEARRRQAFLHRRKESLLCRHKRTDALHNAACLQDAAALQPLSRARKQPQKACIESICTRQSNGVTKSACELGFSRQARVAVASWLLHLLRGVHYVLSKGLKLDRRTLRCKLICVRKHFQGALSSA